MRLPFGCKGIFFSDFASYQADGGYVDAIVDEDGHYSDLWYEIHDNLAPRLKGKLGKTLLGLKYTGNYIKLQYFTPTQNPQPNPVTYDYLTLGLTPSNHDQNWHCGFLERPQSQYADDKYFFLVNLWTTASKSTDVKITPPVQGYNNYRFRNYEGFFDTTFTTQITKELTHTEGEGYLYEVAPVVKYGGKLIYNETVANGTTLNDKMTIQNSATLTVAGNYTANADIVVKSGNIVTTGNGKITFTGGHKLIIEGAATISGTSSHKLTFDFTEDSSGIVIKSGGSLNISYCNIQNADIGIESELNAQYLSAQYVNFSNCGASSIDNTW